MSILTLTTLIIIIAVLAAKLLIKKTTKQFQEKAKPRTWEQIEAEEIII